uniref:Alpha-mannosidase n=1 Tax=Rhabditophanes sp. KR3021 TaxID=114890 RepID=A0AC35TX24_9BILA
MAKEIEEDEEKIAAYKKKIEQLEEQINKKQEIEKVPPQNVIPNKSFKEDTGEEEKKVVAKPPTKIDNQSNNVPKPADNDKTCKMDISSLFKPHDDIQMLNVYENLAFDNPDGGAWKQGWKIEVDEKSIKTKPKLNVIVIPHSHCDPGWLMTFFEYYDKQVDGILTSMTKFLTDNDKMKFIYAEMSFFERFWARSTAEEKQKVKALLKNKQLEFVTAGWVMSDESNAHFFSQIMELMEGHEFLMNQFDYRPKNHWSIDPFGLSPTMAYLLKQSNFSNMVIQRVHYSVKKYLASKKQLEFTWRQLFGGDKDNTDIFTHMMPFFSYDVPHSLGPSPAVACQFDFIRMVKWGCPWGKTPQRIISRNLKERANTLADLFRQKGELYNFNTVLIPLGDDFRYETLEEWAMQHDNFKLLFEYINDNADLNMNVKFGTLEDYFTLVHEDAEKEKKEVPILSGDFFTYADHDDHYWSGYYTSRPFYKRMDRILMHRVRAADITYATFISKGGNGEDMDFDALVEARRTLSLFQHHDGVAGTSKTAVMTDYGQKMLKAIEDCDTLIKKCLEKHLKGEATVEMTETREKEDSLPEQVVIHEDSTVLVLNPLSRHSQEVICVVINNIASRIKGMSDESQEIIPIIHVENGLIVLEKEKFKLCFLSKVNPFGLSSYDIVREPLPGTSIASIETYAANLKSDHFDIKSLDGEEVVIELDVTVAINGKTGFVTKIDGVDADIHFAKYGCRETSRSKPGGEITSGAYLFLPDGPSKKLDDSGNSYVVVNGNLIKQIIVKGHKESKLQHTIEIVRGKNYVNIENIIDLEDVHDFELAMKMDTNVESGEHFYTDLNGFQIIRRKRFAKLPIQGNFYPMPSAAYIEDQKKRFTIVGNQPLGVSSQKDGSLEIILDRRLTADDSRGVAQGVLDNKRTKSSFRIIIDNGQIIKRDNSVGGFLSLRAQMASQSLHYPPVVMYSSTPLDNKPDSYSILKKGLPCDIHVVAIRSLVAKETYKDISNDDLKRKSLPSFALILQRHAFDCSLSPEDKCQQSDDGNLRFKDYFTVDYKSIQNSSLTLMYIDDNQIDKVHMDPMEIKTFKVSI